MRAAGVPSVLAAGACTISRGGAAMHDEAIAAAWSLIDREELADLAVSLGRIQSPPGSEGAVAAEVVAWLDGATPRGGQRSACSDGKRGK